MNDQAPTPARLEESFDALLRALALEKVANGRYRVPAEPGRFAVMFGGQLVAQALQAARDTVEGKHPNSIHAYFVEAGKTNVPVELSVQTVRDGRSIAVRDVTVHQGERTLLRALASFHHGPEGHRFGEAAPVMPSPEAVPTIQDWILRAPAEIRPLVDSWFRQPPPVEIRMTEPLNFIGGEPGHTPRSQWIRLPRGVDDVGLNAVLLAYASDYFVLDMVSRSNPDGRALHEFDGFSLDHSIWFHRPVDMSEWHLYTMTTQAIADERGLVRGVLHDAAGNLVASVMQEGLVRRRRADT